MEEKIKKSIWKTPQYCVTIFMLISAFTTGQGMTENFFNGNIICGIGISIGIQLLLVWMGWKVPKLFMAGNFFTSILLIALYLFTVFWSTGFSFVYVCNHIYTTTHMRDGQEVLEDIYRRDLLHIQDIANERYLDTVNSLKNGLDTLQEQAKGIDKKKNNKIDPTLGLKKLRMNYINDSKMLQVIKNAKKIKKQKFTGDVTSMIETIEERISEIEEHNTDNGEKMDKKQENINKNIDRINSLSQSMQNLGKANDLIRELEAENDRLKKEMARLDKECKDNSKLISKLKNLNSFFENRKDDLETKIISDFSIVLQKLGQKNPSEDDFTEAESKADNIYGEIVNRMGQQHSEMGYGQFLKSYLDFSKALDNLKSIRSILQSNSNEKIVNILKDTEELVKPFPNKEEKKDWSDKWNTELSELKQSFSKLKLLCTGTISVDNNNADSRSTSDIDVESSSKKTPNSDIKTINKATTESTSNIDVESSSKKTPNSDIETINEDTTKISNLQRSLLTEINGIESAIYYLQSEHRLLAVLSFALAVFLDTVPVFLMIVKEGIRCKKNKFEKGARHT